MKIVQRGVLGKSQIFFYSQTQNREAFFYPMSAGHFFCNENYRIQRDRFDSILLTLVLKGSFSFLANGEDLTAKANQISLIDCFKPHLYFTKESFEAYWIHINGANVRALFQEIVKNNGYILEADEELKAAIQTLYQLVKSEKPIGDAVMSQKVYNLLVGLLCVNREEQSSAMNKAIHFINENYAAELSVSQVAEAVHLSASQFSRQFKKQINTSPYDYILSVRLNKSKELLKNTTLPIGEIAYQTGFHSDANYIYCFKKKEGISPLKFRKILF